VWPWEMDALDIQSTDGAQSLGAERHALDISSIRGFRGLE